MNIDPRPDKDPGVLATLRKLIPDQLASFAEVLAVAERQADLLLKLHGVTSAPVPVEIVTDLPRVRVVHEHAPVSGHSHWNGTDWVITLNARDPQPERRITLMHEYAHVIWHGREQHLAAEDPYVAYAKAEQLADTFARHVLIPTAMIAEAWEAGRKHIGDLAEYFDVHEHAILVRVLKLRFWLPPHRRDDSFWNQGFVPMSSCTGPMRPLTDYARNEGIGE